MSARGGTFEWQMTTNGVLLDVQFAKAMERFGKGQFKITLDGDKETHDKERVYRDGRGSFDVIFENVVALAEAGCKVRIGGNFFPDQAASFEKLLDRIERTGVAHKLQGVRVKPIVDPQQVGTGTCTNCSSNQETTTLVQLNKSIERRKMAPAVFQGELLESMLGPCELHSKNNYTIDPEGNVYKCPAVAGLPDLAVTSVRSGAAEKIAPLVELRPWEQCGDCPYMPVCVGGGRGGQYPKAPSRGQGAPQQDTCRRAFRPTVAPP